MVYDNSLTRVSRETDKLFLKVSVEIEVLTFFKVQLCAVNSENKALRLEKLNILPKILVGFID